MQILLSLPGLDQIEASGGVEKTVFRKVCGIPLLARVIATAGRSGGAEVLLLHPKTLPETRLRADLNSADLASIPVQTLALDRAFDPDNPADWQAIESRLKTKFLWTSSPFHGLLACSCIRRKWRARRSASWFAGRGKESDGIYASGARWLCRPAGCWLSKTPVTPNMVTLAGLAVALVSGYWFAQGYWAAYVLGALLYFISVLFDEMDGMLARLTFRESAFGCWLETFVDYASYIVLFVGMTIGLYREAGVLWLAAGGLLLVGTLASILVLIHQRKLATDPARPHEYRVLLHRQLEADSGNILSRFGRLTEFLIRKGAFSYYVLIFSILGGLKILFLLAAFGSNLVWTLGLSFNRFFQCPSPGMQRGECGLPLCYSRAEEGR